jgi:site-specific DNA recombinase
VNRAVTYARVSSKEQRERNTIEAQRHELPLLAARHGLEVVAHYEDNGVSGAAMLKHRHGLLGMLERIARGDVSHVLVFDLDRFTRHVKLSIRGQIFGAIQDSGVVIVESTTGSTYDLGTFEGRLTVQIRAELSADWLEKHKKRIIAGKERAIRENRKPAGPTPYGLDYDRASGTFSIHEPEAAILREIYESIASGNISCGYLAETLNLRGVAAGARGKHRRRATHWTSDRVWRLVTSPVYRGEWTVDKAKAAVLQVPAIVTPELWHEAQRALVSPLRGHPRSRYKGVYLASGIARCVCGSLVQVRTRSGGKAGARYTYYACKAHAVPAIKAKRCPIRARRVEEVDERLWAAVVRTLGEGWQETEARMLGFAQAEHGRDDEARATLARTEDELLRLARVEAALLGRYRRGQVSEAALDQSLDELARDRRRAEEARDQAQGTLGRAGASVRALGAAVAAIRDRLPDAPLEVRQQLVRALIEPGKLRLGEWSIEATINLSWRALSQGVERQAGSNSPIGHKDGEGDYVYTVEVAA